MLRWLVVGAFLWAVGAGVAQTQNSTEGASQTSSAGAGDKGQENESKSNAGFEFPVRILEDSSEVENTRNREQRAEQHDADDLEVQRGAAGAAERSAIAAERQTWTSLAEVVIGIATTVAIIISLLFTRIALRVTRKVGEAQTRAYLGVEMLILVFDEGRLKFRIHNYGQSPAYEVRVETICSGNIELPKHKQHEFGIVDPMHFVRGMVQFLIPDIEKIATGNANLRVRVTISYRDIYETVVEREAEYTHFPLEHGNETLRFNLVGGSTKETERKAANQKRNIWSCSLRW